MLRVALITAFFVQILGAQERSNTPRYLNPDLPLQERVDDLVSRMTLEEKASQMVHTAVAIPRLQIPAYNWWNECLHGVARAGTATVFPQAIGLAATWNTDLQYQVGDVTSTEARAKHHEFVRNGDRDIYKGLTFWSPNINIFRDPRWGRGQETYGEDPYLTSRMGVAFVEGLQGNNPKYFKVIATPKHFAVHSGPEPDRHTFDAVTDVRDLYETYLPAFEACIKEAGAYSVMCAYNRYMGDACCGSNRLLHEILRDKWGFQGYVVSDCWAINDIFERHKIVETSAEAAAMAVRAGTDLECGNIYPPALLEAVEKGLLRESDLDRAVKRLFTARFRLGMFDPPERVPYTSIPFEENDSEEHRRLSVRAAQESVVLLKNSGILPLTKDVKRVAVIGPNADSYHVLLGNYNGTPSRYVTPLRGIENKLGPGAAVMYEVGCNPVQPGGVIHSLTSDIAIADGKKGLKAEYFRNDRMEGDPFFTQIDRLDNPNWIYGTRNPNLNKEPQYSIRWSGQLTIPATGRYRFTVTGGDGYRLLINGEVALEDWTEHESTARTAELHLEKDDVNSIRVEYYRSSQRPPETRPQLFIQWEHTSFSAVEHALAIASQAEVVIFVGGITPQLEGEEMRVVNEGFSGGDRTDLNLPKVQVDLLKALQSTGKPIILVLTSGSALSVNWANENIPAIVQLWYPGQEGGTALADVLFGDYNPAGRLPVTFYKSVDQLPSFKDYSMRGRTYRYFDGEPLFAFGHGLSYSRFEYSNLKLPGSVGAGRESGVSVEVRNAGKMAGDEVVQLYTRHVKASVNVPLHSLQGFVRVHLNPGEKKVVTFQLKPRQMALFNEEKGGFVVSPGDLEISVGGLLPGTKAPTTESLTSVMKITGKAAIVE